MNNKKLEERISKLETRLKSIEHSILIWEKFQKEHGYFKKKFY